MIRSAKRKRQEDTSEENGAHHVDTIEERGSPRTEEEAVGGLFALSAGRRARKMTLVATEEEFNRRTRSGFTIFISKINARQSQLPSSHQPL
ncbi:hypothetical protein NDU88_002614 [Pleurodeles waltl]|uniref:Uncharacterized protein n=1 Tax=Pleurodeles waltl TaxID=8319 RepID=A0AAV7WSV5_PLEWA|nr:hypothetical protein NDU88_002614 [Pleurodeles waltl]